MKTCIRGKQTHYKCRKMKLWSVTIKCRIGCLQRQWVLYVWIISPIIVQKHLIASKWTQRVLFLTAVMSFAYLISLLFPLCMSVCLYVCTHVEKLFLNRFFSMIHPSLLDHPVFFRPFPASPRFYLEKSFSKAKIGSNLSKHNFFLERILDYHTTFYEWIL